MRKNSFFLSLIILGSYGAVAQTNSLTVQDTRATSTTPSNYNQALQAHFKHGPILGLPNYYYTVLGLRGWVDNSGGPTHELAFGEEGIRYRAGHEPTWGDWKRVLIGEENGDVHFSGDLGLGKLIPEARLDLDGSMLIRTSLTNTSLRPNVNTTRINGEIRGYSQTGLHMDDGFLRLSAGGGTHSTTTSFIDLSGYSTVPDMDRNILLGTAGEERLRIAANGNVGIGTSVPAEKLSVNGKVRAKEVKVEVANWPDYVFSDDYEAAPLFSLESFIKKNKHLPEVPSAKQVAEDGIELGEMNKILLKKIEELTLYMIELKKENNEVKLELSKIRNEIKSISSKKKK